MNLDQRCGREAASVAMTDPRSSPPNQVRPPAPLGLGCLTAISAVVGAIVLPVVVLAVEIVIYRLDPQCGGPGDEGGCAMGVAANTIMAAPLGFAIGVIVALMIGLRRKPRSARREGGPS
jgi:ABC-type Fe3+ transport system permease subunit